MRSLSQSGLARLPVHAEGLVKRYCKFGMDSLLDQEVLELLLAVAGRGEAARPLADGLVDWFGSFRRVLDEPIDDLAAFPGMDLDTAVILRIAKDCSEYYLKQRIVRRHSVRCGPDLLKYLRMSMAGLANEQFRAVFLNTQSEIIEIETLQEGTLDQSAVYPRKVMERAFYHRAAALILVHNHTGRDVRPSYSDKEITNTLVAACKSVDIEVYDHIIIGADGYFSFRDSGLLHMADELTAGRTGAGEV